MRPNAAPTRPNERPTANFYNKSLRPATSGFSVDSSLAMRNKHASRRLRVMVALRTCLVFSGCVLVSLSTRRWAESMEPVDTTGSRTEFPLAGHLARRLLNVELDNSSPLVMDWRAGIAIPLYLIMSMLAISSGVGGGLFWVPLFTALLQFSVKSAAALSQSCVAGGCIGGTLYSFMQRHPHDKERPVMDYNLALVLMPALVQGISFGVMLNYILPSLILSCLLIITLLLISARTLHQGIKMVRAERRVRLEEQAREEEELETRRSPMSPGYTDDETATFDDGSLDSRQSPVGVVEDPDGAGKESGVCKIPRPDVLAAKLSLAEEGRKLEGGRSKTAKVYRGSIKLIKTTTRHIHRHTSKRVVRVLGKIQRPLIPWLPFLSNWGIFAVFLGLQVGKSFFSNCSWETWTMFSIQIVFMVSTSTYFIWFQEHPAPLKLSHHHLEGGSDEGAPSDDGSEARLSNSSTSSDDDENQEWEPRRLALIWTMTLLLGALAGMVGLGGGVMMSPLLLELRVHPQAAAATSTFITLFASTTAAVTFGLDDRLNLQYMALFAPICALGGFLGVYVLTGLIKKYKCTSLVSVLVGSLILLSAILVGAFSLRDEAEAVAGGQPLVISDWCTG